MWRCKVNKYELKYRVIENSSYSDFNNELKYTLVAVDYNPKTDLIRQRGFSDWGRHHCDLFSSKKAAEKWLCELNYNHHLNKDKQLQKQLTELKSDNEELKNVNMVIFEDNKKLEEENLQLQQQLKEKDEEIEEYQKLINDICNKFYAGSLNDLPKKITKQVCEKIREKVNKTDFNKIPQKVQQAIKFSICYEIDKIDKGESL